MSTGAKVASRSDRASLAVAAALACLWPAAATAQPPEEQPARVVVDFVAEEPAAAWIAAAYEQNVYRDLAAFHRITLLDKRDARADNCPGREVDCLLDAYRDAGAEIVMLGRLAGNRLDYETYENWTGTLVSTGTYRRKPGTSLARLRQETLRAMGPFFASGGLLEQRRFLLAGPRGSPAGRALIGGTTDLGARLALFLLILLLVLPYAATRLVAGREAFRQMRGASWRWTGVLLLAASALLVAVSIPGLAAFWRATPAAEWLGRRGGLVVAVAGGLSWGWLTLLLFRIVLPRLHGIERIRHGNLGFLLEAWLYSTVLRTVPVAAVAVPLGWGVVAAGNALGTDPRLLWTLILPLAGLLAAFLLVSLVDNLSLLLDRLLVDGPASTENPWHPAIKRYFLGYLRRSGIQIEQRLLDRALFLPGDTSGVVIYGGALSPPRILVDPALLDIALGQVEEDTEPPPRPVELDDWTAGTLLPSEEPSEAKVEQRARQRRVARRLEKKRRRQKKPLLRRYARPRLIGQNETLLGTIAPLPVDETVPLIADDREDFGVVRELLTDHYAAFERSSYEEEYDDTDPTQKDFLFGALLRAMGDVQRRDAPLSTLVLTATAALERSPSLLRRAGRFFGDLAARLTSRYPAMLADAHAALNLGRDALIQYLYLLATADESLLTARADVPTLHRTSSEILKRIAAGEPDRQDRQRLRATVRNRLVWLSRFFYTPIPEERGRALRYAAMSVIAALIAAVVSWEIALAIDYAPVYAKRMRALTEQLEQQHEEPDHAG
jgi:hypothetical protein